MRATMFSRSPRSLLRRRSGVVPRSAAMPSSSPFGRVAELVSARGSGTGSASSVARITSPELAVRADVGCCPTSS